MSKMSKTDEQIKRIKTNPVTVHLNRILWQLIAVEEIRDDIKCIHNIDSSLPMDHFEQKGIGQNALNQYTAAITLISKLESDYRAQRKAVLDEVPNVKDVSEIQYSEEEDEMSFIITMDNGIKFLTTASEYETAAISV